MLSDKIRGLLSTWMAGYARGLVNECADEAAKLERVARAADKYWVYGEGQTELIESLKALPEGILD